MATSAWDGWQRQFSSNVNRDPVDLGDDDAFRLALDVAEGRIGVEDIADRPITS
jgi:hypothetical protein